MIEINAFSIIMLGSLLGVAIFGLWCNYNGDYQEIKELLKQ